MNKQLLEYLVKRCWKRCYCLLLSPQSFHFKGKNIFLFIHFFVVVLVYCFSSYVTGLNILAVFNFYDWKSLITILKNYEIWYFLKRQRRKILHNCTKWAYDLMHETYREQRNCWYSAMSECKLSAYKSSKYSAGKGEIAHNEKFFLFPWSPFRELFTTFIKLNFVVQKAFKFVSTILSTFYGCNGKKIPFHVTHWLNSTFMWSLILIHNIPRHLM